MENIETTYNDEEEISLIDLFAVLIRFRKMICIGTGIVTILAGLYLFVLPKLLPSFGKRELSVTYNIAVKPFPKTIESGLQNLGVTFDLQGNLQKEFTNYPSIAKEYKKFPFLGDDYPENSRDYNLFIKNLVTEKKIALDTKMTFKSNSYNLDCKVAEVRFEMLNDFVNDYLNNMNESIKEESAPYIEELEKKAQTMAENSASVKISSSLSTLNTNAETNFKETLQDIASYKKGSTVFYSVAEEPFVLNVAQGRVKKLIIVCFAAFFIFVFVAFAKNAVLNIKADPEASKTIQNAWEAGK